MFDSNSLAHRLPVIEGANALVAFLFAASAPVAIILSAGIRGGLTEADLASWIFAAFAVNGILTCLLYTSPSPRDATLSRMPSSA